MNLVQQQPNFKMLVFLSFLISQFQEDAVINYFRMDGIEVALFSKKKTVMSSLTIKVHFNSMFLP